MVIERRSPRSTSICEQDIDIICRGGDLFHKVLYACEIRAISGHGDGFGTGLEIGEGVEKLNSGFTCGGFAGSDVDFACSCLEESMKRVKSEVSYPSYNRIKIYVLV